MASLADALLKHNMLGRDTRAAAVAVAPIFLSSPANRNALTRVSGGLFQQLNNLQGYSRRVISTLRAIAAEKIRQQTVIERIDRQERENRAEMIRLQPERQVQRVEDREEDSSGLVSTFLRILREVMSTISRALDIITNGIRRLLGTLRQLAPAALGLLRAIPLLMGILRRHPAIVIGGLVGSAFQYLRGRENELPEEPSIPRTVPEESPAPQSAPSREPTNQSQSPRPSSLSASQPGTPERVNGGITEIVQSGAGFNIVRYDTGRVERRTGARNWRNNNPGNIEFGNFSRRYGAIGSDGRFAIFPTYEMGRRAKEALLFETPSYANLTIAQAITRYAPPSENNTASYINTVANSIGVDPNTPLQNLTPQQRQTMLSAMERVEGFRSGSVQIIEPGRTYASQEQPSGTPSSPQPTQQTNRGPQVSVAPTITPSVQQAASYVPQQQTSAGMFILPVVVGA